MEAFDTLPKQLALDLGDARSADECRIKISTLLSIFSQ